MNKILALYDLEFKQIYKLYFGGIIAYIILNLGGALVNLYNTASSIASNLGVKISFSLLSKVSAARTIREIAIFDIYNFSVAMFLVTITFCILYCFMIWDKDFKGRSKTIYTLYMLPIDKFNIYISKLLLIASLIYGLVIAHTISWAIIVVIITSVSTVTANQIIQIIFLPMNYDILNPIGFNGIEFLMIDILGVVVSVAILFTGIIIRKSFKKVGILLGMAYVVLAIFINLCIHLEYAYTGRLLIYQCICYILTMIISFGVSYFMINKKINL